MREFLERFSSHALDAMSTGAPAEPLLSAFAAQLQAELPGAVVGITVLDQPGRTFRYALFPALPLTFSQTLENNVITGRRGSCGLAVLTGKVVEVPDVANDERFSAEWKALFARHQLQAMYSTPALAQDGTVQGSVAVIHPFDFQLTTEQRGLIHCASVLCAKLCAYSRTQESAQLLVGELEHRIRNLFMTIGSVASLTIKMHPQPNEFRRVFAERLLMMHRAHALGLNASEIDLASLVQEMLAPYQPGHDIVCSGPTIILAPEAAAALALVIHELATNAAKYGALSRPQGKLHIEWCVTPQGGELAPLFSLDWAERDGPPVQPPTRKGYGSTMINGSLRNALDGAATFSYAAERLSCAIRAPFTHKIGKQVGPDRG